MKIELSKRFPTNAAIDMMGYIPEFLSENDPRPAVEQLHENYAHGGGWFEFKGFDLQNDDNGIYFLKYPGDPEQWEVARIILRDEIIVIFQHAWVAVVQKDGSYVTARMD